VWAQVAIGVRLFLAGIVCAAATIFGALWASRPVRQRDEARDELAKALERAKFPRGRIEVRDVGYFDTEKGERLLAFGVKVTNRENAQRMNLEVDFFLRLFGQAAKLNPHLKPIDLRLWMVQRDMNRPPSPLIVEPQHSTPEFTYVVEWGLAGLVFDEEGHTFRTESDAELILGIFDLQTGGRIEIPIPNVWES
jgi:hypothetical protein